MRMPSICDTCGEIEEFNDMRECIQCKKFVCRECAVSIIAGYACEMCAEDNMKDGPEEEEC
jgi:hypothetical protein